MRHPRIGRRRVEASLVGLARLHGPLHLLIGFQDVAPGTTLAMGLQLLYLDLDGCIGHIENPLSHFVGSRFLGCEPDRSGILAAFRPTDGCCLGKPDRMHSENILLRAASWPSMDLTSHKSHCLFSYSRSLNG